MAVLNITGGFSLRRVPSSKLKTNSFFVGDCKGLLHLFFYRCLQMWSSDCKRFTSEKTNNTLFCS
ncbi:hypothetical protein Hanom_Chr09g00763671 [Helianthus anomalus]